MDSKDHPFFVSPIQIAGSRLMHLSQCRKERSKYKSIVVNIVALVLAFVD
jgi:hypothetical protein